MPSSQPAPSASPLGAASLESRLLERIEMYQTAIANAKAAGETSKARRYDRGLKVSAESNFLLSTLLSNQIQSMVSPFLFADITVHANIGKERQGSE